MIGLTQAFTDAARMLSGDGAPQASAESLDPNWRAAILHQIDALIAAWQDPVAWEGDASAAGAVAPAAVMRQVAMNAILVHG